MCTINRLLRYEVQQTEFFLSSCAIFCTFTPLTAQQMKISNMKKKTKKIGDIIILHRCTKIMIIHYTVPEIWHVTDVIVIFILSYTFPFYLPPPPSPNSPKNENFTTKKKLPGDIIILHMCTKNHDHMLYCPFTPPRPQPPPPP